MPRTPVGALATLLTISTGAMLAGGAIRAAAIAAVQNAGTSHGGTEHTKEKLS
jgi:hypothetical protein